MAKTTGNQPGDQAKEKPKMAKSVLTWGVTGLLILGLGGFGIGNFGGTVTSIGSVGKIDLSTRDYAQALRDETAKLSQQLGTNISVQQALGFGIERQALAALVTGSALDDAARTAGLSVGDTTVGLEITKDRTFTGSSGGFDREVYRQTLSRAGWRESDYEEKLRRDVSRSLLGGAVSGGFTASAAATDVIYKWIAERRGFSLIRLSEASLETPVTEPDEAAVKAYYEAQIARFTRPEAKRLRYALLSAETLAAGMPVDEAQVRAIYDARIAEYVIPPRRLVERLVYPDEAAREAALQRMSDEGASFEYLVAARGLPMDAVDMGDVSEADLGSAGATVFAADEGAVVPAETSLGPALFRINMALPGEETGFDEVRADLAHELQLEEARQQINTRIDEIDDLLAGGSGIDDLAAQVGMETGELIHVPGGNAGTASANRLEGYDAFRRAADALQEDAFLEAVILDDGGVVVPEFLETLPPAPIPFEEVRSEVVAAMQEEALRDALTARGLALKSEAEAGADFATLGTVETVAETSRDGANTNLTPAVLEAAFAMVAGDIRLIEDGNAISLLRLDHVTTAPDDSEEAFALKAAISSQIEAGIAQDAFSAFTTSVAEGVGMSIDQNAINLVNSSLQ